MVDNGGSIRRSGRRWLWIIAGGALVGAVLAVVAIWHLPDRMYPGTYADVGEARAALQGGLLTAAAALTAVAGALIALDETRQANSEVRRANAETQRANEAADVREREANANTHVRELYTAAIGMLGADTIDVRLGGIYALERVARDSVDDQRTILEVLSAFVREHAHPPAEPIPLPRHGTNAFTGLATDVQAAVTVLGRLPVRREPGADLHEADLTDAHLTGADLTNALLFKTDLTGARLSNANLTGAALFETNLTDAYLDGVNLTNALLIRANLGGAVGLVQEQVDFARGDGRTRLPEGLVRPMSWGPEEPPNE